MILLVRPQGVGKARLMLFSVERSVACGFLVFCGFFLECLRFLFGLFSCSCGGGFVVGVVLGFYVFVLSFEFYKYGRCGRGGAYLNLDYFP
jgi:hypothetical protein